MGNLGGRALRALEGSGAKGLTGTVKPPTPADMTVTTSADGTSSIKVKSADVLSSSEAFDPITLDDETADVSTKVASASKLDHVDPGHARSTSKQETETAPARRGPGR